MVKLKGTTIRDKDGTIRTLKIPKGTPIRDERGIIGAEGQWYDPKNPMYSAERAGEIASNAQLKGKILLVPGANPKIPTRILPGDKRPVEYLHDAIMKKWKGKKLKVRGKLT